MVAHVDIINPDAFLETPSGRVWMPERSKDAWARCFRLLEGHLQRSAPTGMHRLLIVCGLQGAGKSHWIRLNARRYAPCIVFDAALPGIRHRQPILELARRYGADVIAVWIDTPIDVALARNALRAADQRVPEESILNVAAMFQPPTLDEGVREIVRWDVATPEFRPVVAKH